MKKNRRIVKQAALSAFAALALLSTAAFDPFETLSSATSVFAQTRASSRVTSRSGVRSASSTRTVDAQRNAADRYRKTLYNNPRFGAAFDRVYREASRVDGCETLISDLQKEAQESQGETKGKRLLLLGLVYLRRDLTDAALDALAEAEALLPEDGFVSVSLGRAYLLQGRLQDGCASFERALDKTLVDSDRIDALQKLGETYAKLEEREKAEKVWRDAIEKFGDDVDVLRSIADAQADAGLYREASALFARLEKEAAARKDVQAEIEFAVACGDMKTRLGEKEEALVDFDRALDKLAPNHWLYKSLRDRIEYAYMLRSDYDGLIERYRARLEVRPNDVDAARRLVVVLGALSRYEEAETAIASARKRAPRDASLCKSELELALAQNDNKRADELYAELDSIESSDVDVCLAWGAAALKNDSLDAKTRKSRAIEIWTRPLKSAKVSSASALLVADRLAENDFNAEAEEILQGLIDAEPDDFENCANLARFYFKTGAREQGFAVLDRYAKGREKEPDAWDKRAAFLRSVGFGAEGVAAARSACELTPGDFRRALYLCESESEVDGRAQESDLVRAEELAQTDSELDRVFAERVKFARSENLVAEYLDSLRAALDARPTQSEAERIYWKLATCSLAFDDPSGAIDAAIDAFNANAVSQPLAAKIQEIAAKSQEPERALELLDLAIAKDPVNASNYLRSRARLCLELGKTDEAISSASRLIETDPGRAEHYRAYAEVLIESGRYDEAIAALRRASSIGSSDRASELRLASLLDEVGKTGEALESIWEVFDRASRLEEKLTLIDPLSKLAAKLDQFDALKERLQTTAKTPDARRENAYCLARAYMTLKDYESARATLENAVAFMGSRSDDSAFWLHALSNLAELQNDISGAIRFQEQLCELDSSSGERNRLLSLYRRSGDTSLARDYLVQKILPTEPLWKRLETVDTLLSLDDYELASAILDDLELNYPNSWEILARRMTIAGWTGSSELSELIDRVLARKEDWNAKSSKASAIEFDRNTSTTTVSGDAWAVGEVSGRAVAELSEPSDYRDLAAQTLTVVYRDKLQLKDKRALSSSPTLTRPQKPIPSYATFGAVRFEALCRRERLSHAAEEEGAADLETLDSAALKTRYLLDAYKLAELEGQVVKSAEVDADAIEADLRRVALALASRERVWRVDAFSSVLAETVETQDAATLSKNAAFILETLENSLDQDRLKKDSKIWKEASFAASTLKRKGLDAEAARVRELVKLAGARDYTALLTVDENAEYVSFESFADSWKSAEAEVLRQVRNKSDVERARAALGETVLARAEAELYDAFKDCDKSFARRLAKNGTSAETLVEKASFGRSVVNSFISLNRRDLFENGANDAFAESASKDFETRVYRLLDFVVAADERLRETFTAKEGKRVDTGVIFTTADVLGRLGRGSSTSLSMATYLVDKTLYGGTDSRSLVDSSRAFEYSFGALFTLDVVDATPEEQLKGEYRFERLRRFEKYVDEFARRSDDVRSKLYAQQLLETSLTLQAAACGEVVSDSAADLRAKAEANITLYGETSRETNPLYVALAMLAEADGELERELEYVERVRCVGFAETKARELALVGALLKADAPKLAARRDAAIETLMGARLDENEGAALLDLLEEGGYSEEAVKIRRRLESLATSDKIVEALLDDLLARVKDGETLDDLDVVFALRVFRTPSTSLQSGERLASLRAKSLAALNSAGKLGETLEKMETVVADAPGAYETVLRLAEVKLQLGDAESARSIVSALEGRAPNDAAILFDYAAVLERVGEPEKAKDVLKTIYVKKLEDYFKGSARPSFWTFADDASFIEETSFEQIAPYAYYAFSILLEGTQSEDADVVRLAYAAIDRLWNCDGASEEVRDALHKSGSRLLAQSGDRRFFALLSEFFVESIEPNASENEPYPEFQDVHRVVLWSDRAPETLSIDFLALADVEDDSAALDALLAKTDAICDVYAARPNENPARHSAALVLDVMLLLKLGRLDAALERIASAEKFESFCAPEFPNDSLSLGLAFERFLSAEDREKASETLLKYYVKGYSINTHSVYEPYYISRIYPLGTRSSDAETAARYRLLALKKLQEVLRLAAKADLTSDRRVGGSLETVETIALYSEALTNAFIANGEGEVVSETIRAVGLADRLDAAPEDALDEWKAIFADLKSKL